MVIRKIFKLSALRYLTLLIISFMHLLFLSFPAAGEDMIDFADDNLQDVVLDRLNEKNKPLTSENLARIEELEAIEMEIEDLSGLQNLSGLKNIYFRDNSVTDITPLSARENITGVASFRGNELDLDDEETAEQINILRDRVETIRYEPQN